MYASMYAGFVPVNINARYKAKELNYVLHDSKCKILFTSSQSDEVTNFSEIISSVYDSTEGQPEELIDVYIIGGSTDNRFRDFKEFESIFVDDSLNEEATGSEDDPAFIMYTSGTTSNPKGCPLSHKNVLHVANSMVDRWKMNDKDVFGILFQCFICRQFYLLLDVQYQNQLFFLQFTLIQMKQLRF